MTTLTRTRSENRIEEKLKTLIQPKLLIIDEIGYLPLGASGREPVAPADRAPLRARIDHPDFEPEPIGWGDVLGDPIIATAILGGGNWCDH